MKKLLSIFAFVLLAGIMVAGLYAYDEDPVASDSNNTQLIPGYGNQDGSGRGMRRPMDGRGMNFWAEELGLTDEQKDQLDAMRTEHQKMMIEIDAKADVLRLEMRELMKTRGNDDAVIAKHAELQAVMSKIRDMRLQHRLEARKVFTDEQWDKISDFMGKGRGMRGGRGFDRPGRGDGMGRSGRSQRGGGFGPRGF